MVVSLMKKEIFTEKTKNTDTSNQKIKISIFSGIIVIILVFFVGGLFLFAAESDEDEVVEADYSNPYNLPEISNEQIENITVSNNETFLATLYVDGKYYVESFKKSDNPTVMDLINSVGITLSEEDSVSYGTDTLLTEDMVISVNRVYYEETVTYEPVAYQTEAVSVIYSTFANRVGTETAGKDGRKEIVTRTKYVNGEAVESTVISEKIVENPISAKVYVDASNLLDTGGGAPSEYVSKIENVTFTAYGPSDGGGSRTATGHSTQVGYVAVDPSVIPLYSKLYIVMDNGFVYGYAYAMDTGGAVKGNIVDIFLPSTYDCNRFGRRTGTVYVVSSGR